MSKSSRVSVEQAKYLADLFGLNLSVLKMSEWKYGLEIELEHGTENPITNITNDDLILTAKIALAHIMEFPDYYKRLKRLEEQAKKYWSRRKKLNVLF